MGLLSMLRRFSRGSWGPQGWEQGGGRQFVFFRCLGVVWGPCTLLFMNFFFLAGNGGQFYY